MAQKIIITIFISFIICSVCFADTLYLKNGKIIQGKIIEETAEHVKINCLNLGFYAKYKRKEIEKIEIEKNLDAVFRAKVATEIIRQNKLQRQGNNTAKNDSTIPPEPKNLIIANNSSQIIEKENYTLYIPGSIDAAQKHPLLLCLHPGADAFSMIELWKNIAEKHKWLICASKTFRNNINDWELPVKSTLLEVCDNFPVDRAKIIATGLSGGGMGSHILSAESPELIKAIIVNTGRINPYYKEKAQQEKYPRGKIAAFLASPEDFGYKHMQDDERFLKNLGWITLWLEFPGGHISAPEEMREETVKWIEQQLR